MNKIIPLNRQLPAKIEYLQEDRPLLDKKNDTYKTILISSLIK